MTQAVEIWDSNDSRNAEDSKIAHARQVPYHSGYQTPNQDPRYSNVDNSRSQGPQQYPSETVHKGRWFDAELQVNFFLGIFFLNIFSVCPIIWLFQ